MGEIFYIKKVKKGITNLNNFKGDNKNQRTFQVFLIISRKN